MPSPIRIGIVAWQAISAAAPPPPGHAGQPLGGTETAAWTMAKHLAERDDCDVTLFVIAATRTNAGASWPALVDGVRLAIRHDPFRNLRRDVSVCIDVTNRRILRPRWSLLWQVPALVLTRPFRRRDPDPRGYRVDPFLRSHGIDAWIAMGVNRAAADVVATAADQGAVAIVSVRSNDDIHPDLAGTDDFVNQYGEHAPPRRYAIRRSTALMVQTDWQRRQLREHFGIDARQINNPIDPARWQAAQAKTEDAGVLWVGRYDTFHKRPELMFQAARRVPEIPITMVINPFDDDVQDRLRSQRPANVNIVGRVAADDMPELFRRHRVFVSTGSPQHEGFPNVLLQAAATHTPIVSLSDFDGFLRNSGAGVACDESVPRLADEIRSVWHRSRIDFAAVDRHLRTHYDAQAIAATTAQWIRSLIADRGGS